MFENNIFEEWLDDKAKELRVDMDKRFEQVDKRFNEMLKRLDRFMFYN